MQTQLVRDANVTIESTRNEKNHPIAIATINDRYQHRFDASSRVSKSLDHMTPVDLAARLTGGQFFFVEDTLVDFRDSHYNGFVHTDESIAHLQDVVGISRRADISARGQKNLVSNDFYLGSKWSNHEITVPGYQSGGDFTSELHFGWNPFVKTINSAFMLMRLICTNGMEGLSSILNSKIPLVNRWEEHLDIANMQIQNKVDGIVTRRLGQMGAERATVAETMLIAHHAQKRLSEASRVGMDETARERLRNISNIAHPMPHLGHVYKSSVFQDKRLAAQMPAHLSTFDVYNMATELSSHTTETAGSSDHALGKFANQIVFDRKDQTSHVSRYTAPQLSSFSDPDAAFYGKLN
jgi:hypothetical protein